MTNQNNEPNGRDDARDGAPEIPRGDRLDAMLRAWHDENAAAAREKRDEIVRALAREQSRRRARPVLIDVVARIGFARLAAAAMFLVASALVISMFVGPTGPREAFADDGIMQVADGGVLEAMDAEGNPLGACPLRRTNVEVEISGPFARTVVEQTYVNPHPRTIEAVYTFPLSNRAAVDRMTMIVRGASGEKIIEGEVKESAIARAIYEEARESGYVASLLEQERPNIFTQSVANIEPGATVKIRIATIEMVERKDGVSQYSFPMTVGPRYIPGASALASQAMPKLPGGWTVREGIVLRGPAKIEVDPAAPISGARLERMLVEAIPVRAGDNAAIDAMLAHADGIQFLARYANGSAERGMFSPANAIGEINGRFFFVTSATQAAALGTGFAQPTDQVPDASKITPMPTRPEVRAGHDISVKVTIDAGGATIGAIESVQHEVSVEVAGEDVGEDVGAGGGAATRRVISLVDEKTIPNRDFMLRWTTGATGVEPSFFAHTSSSSDADAKGGFFALLLEPPARVAPSEIRPRELVFVLDVSGSMNGFPIEKSKELARKAIARMRPNDTFNIITFAGNTAVLWPEPKPATAENLAVADQFIAGTSGAGGTEMMTAINAALVQPGRSGIEPARLLELPADGRTLTVAVPADALTVDGARWKIDAGAGAAGVRKSVLAEIPVILPENPKRLAVLLEGAWTTKSGDRVFVARTARFEDADARTRLVFFLTDGYIGNDQAVVQAVLDNARASRVFSFGIGSSVNRFLLDEMARAGRGVSEVVTLAEDADAVVDRLVRRIDAPVLTDLELAIDPALGLRDVMPSTGRIADLYDVEPLVLLGRFDRAARGSITLRGRTGAGPWERTVSVELPEREERHDVVPTLWARAKVDEILLPKLAAVENETLDATTRRSVIRLGEAFHITTPFTSFVAVEKSRVVVGGKPMLVAVPVELPSGTNWNGFFGEGVGAADVIAGEARGSRQGGAIEAFGADFARLAVERGLVERAYTRDVVDAPSELRLREVESGQRATNAAPGAPIAAAPSAAPAFATPAPPTTSGAPPVVSGRIAAPSSRVVAKSAPASAPQQPGGGRLPSAGGFGANAAAESGRISRDAAASRPGRRTFMDQSVTPKPGSFGGTAGGGAIGSAESDEATGAASDAAVESAGASTGARADAAPAPSPIDALLDASTRDALVRVLDRRLVVIALAAMIGEESRIPALAAELDLGLENGMLLVSMKVDVSAGAVAPSVIEALREVGAVISAENAARGLVVAMVPPSGLPALAETKGISRVEALRGGDLPKE
jgi:hypothetical protein